MLHNCKRLSDQHGDGVMAAIHSALPLHMRKCTMASDWFGENNDSLCHCHSTVAIDTSVFYIPHLFRIHFITNTRLRDYLYVLVFYF